MLPRAFSRAGAHASVNHAHCHGWYTQTLFSDQEGRLPVEHFPSTALALAPGPHTHGVVLGRHHGYAVPYWSVQCKETVAERAEGQVGAGVGPGVVAGAGAVMHTHSAARSPRSVARDVAATVVACLVRNNVPHHVCLVSGGSTIYILPRAPQADRNGGAINVALAGIPPPLQQWPLLCTSR
jgi:hypothetical protein